MNPLKMPNPPTQQQVAAPTTPQLEPNQDPSFLGLNLEPQDIPSGDPLAPFDPNGGNPVPEVSAPSQIQPKDDERRHEYWQSKHDRLQAQFNQYEPYRAQLEVLKQRPDIANQVLALAAGVQVVPQAAAAPAGPVEPKPPQRPLHYDPTDTNPESESFKYRLAWEDYLHQKVEFLEQKEEMRSRAFEESLQMAAQERQREQVFNQTRSAIAQFGITGQAADVFMNWASNPQIEMEDLVQLFAMKYGRQPNQSPVAQGAPPIDPRIQATAAMNQRRQQVLPSLAGVTAQTPPTPTPVDENQVFSQGFLTAAKRYG